MPSPASQASPDQPPGAQVSSDCLSSDHRARGQRAPDGPWRPTDHRAKSLADILAHLGPRARLDPRADLRDTAGPTAGPPTTAGPATAGGGTPLAVAVTGTSQDSRLVRPGDLYVALPGQRHHGGAFVGEAAARGAVAVLARDGDPLTSSALPVVRVGDPRAVVGPLASYVYDDPSAAMDVFGVTGTNGKTSTAHLIDAGLTGAGVPSALFSGVVQRTRAASRAAGRTTPEACELQQVLAAARGHGARAATVEVSSHGLALHRVDGTAFTAAVFTNLGPDHLDLHGDMESYRDAKAALFTAQRCALAVIAVDDDAGRWLAEHAGAPVVTTSATGADADWRADDVHLTPGGSTFRLRGPDTDLTVRLQLLGAHQVDNALGALAALASTGVELGAAVAGVEAVTGVPGRLERVDAGQPFLALVDHAHNPSAQLRLFPYLRAVTRGRIVVVLGATGGRDAGKRHPLGAQAGAMADTVVITDESPHDDDPRVLREDVAAGARAARSALVIVEPDRTRALELAVACTDPGDVLVVAGRGDDPALVRAGVATPFDDRVVLHEVLRRRLAAG